MPVISLKYLVAIGSPIYYFNWWRKASIESYASLFLFCLLGNWRKSPCGFVGWCSNFMNLLDTFRIFSRVCWNIRLLYLSFFRKKLFVLANTVVGRKYYRLWPTSLIVCSIDLQKIVACFWKLIYKAFFVLKWIHKKSTTSCSNPNIVLL